MMISVHFIEDTGEAKITLGIHRYFLTREKRYWLLTYLNTNRVIWQGSPLRYKTPNQALSFAVAKALERDNIGGNE